MKGLYVPADGEPKVYTSDTWHAADLEFLLKQSPSRAAQLPYVLYRHRLVAYYGAEHTDGKIPRPCVVLALRGDRIISLPLESILRITTALVLEEVPQLEGRLTQQLGLTNPKGTFE